MLDAERKEHRNPMIGIGLKIISVVIFVVMMTCIKAAGILPPGQIVFFRSFFALLPIIAFLVWQKGLSTAFRTTRPLSHIVRGFVGVLSMGLGFFGLTLLPLPDAIAINYAQPLFVIVFSALFLGETIRMFRWSAVAAGLIGVLIVSWPKLSVLTGEAEMGHSEALGVGVVLLSAMFAAMAMLMVRRLVDTERTATIVIWFSVNATVFSLLTLPFGWAPLTINQIALLVSAGILGGIAQLLMTQAYRYAEMSTIAPFEYSSMLLGIVFGYFFFADIPTVETIVGGTIVVAAGIFIIWRENRLGIERKAARRTMSPQG